MVDTIRAERAAWPAPEPAARPQQPWLHELVVCVDGNATALGTRDGSLGAIGTGLFVDDRRVLSLLEVQLGSDPTAPVIDSARGDVAEFWGSARRHGDVGADPTVEIQQHRQVRRSGLTETITVVNRSGVQVTDTLYVRLGGDGAPIHDVKTGLPAGPLLAAEARGDDEIAWRDDRHETVVTVSPSPRGIVAGVGGSADEQASAATVFAFDVDLAPGARVSVTFDVDPVRTRASAFDADPGAHLVDWGAASVVADDTRLTETLSSALADLQHLLMTDPEAPDDVFAGAGTPWYLTLFGRDSLWAARLMLPFSTELAAGTLRTLARRQGVKDDPVTAEAPGKILHEVRRDLFDQSESGLHLPTVYYGTVDATPLWICLLHDSWRSGLSDNEVRDLLPTLQRAVVWMTAAAEDSDDGLLRYVDTSGSGLANQGWKDSGDSMRRIDGEVAPAPIALLEAQAYTVEAARGAAALYREFGLEGAEQLESFADRLTERVRDTYWVDRDGVERLYPAMAVDGEGRLVDGIGSNMGHALGTGVLTADEATRVTAMLTSETMFGRFGISTLARRNPAFNPIGYHSGSVWTHDTAICALGMSREGHTEAAAAVARSLVESAAAFDYRWPELYSGEPVLGRPAPYPASCRPQAWSAASASAIVQAVLGLSVDVPAQVVRVNPVHPTPFGAMQVRGLRYGPTTFTVTVDTAGQVAVDGLPDGVTVEIG
ncbi:amylo-alpha-1,6-glucosidase [Arsenicicoccus piscis]|uniref:glycogen debranching N-terminal domain-containing protein n=1 Tax=Arsenicicoccus piscis TaxID=673954 RepID=UPI001F4D14F3|nr:amylo-alpha-1,6-glucosidase [Arsenicicoccus piscis]